MRALVLVMLFVLCLPLQADAQEKIDWKKEIEGNWKLNQPKTKKLALEGIQRNHAENLGMVPIASPSIVFTGETIAFELCSQEQPYQLESYDPESKRIELSLETDGRKSTINFTAEDIDTLILDLPASVLGPIQIVYSRAVTKGKGQPDSAIAKLAGDWQLEEELTRSMWKDAMSAETLKEFSSVGNDELSKTLQITPLHILYGDQTFEPWDIQVEEGSKIVSHSPYRPQMQIEINKISDDLIQIADSRKRLFAVYSRGKNEQAKAEAVAEFPESRVAHGFLSSFKPQPPRVERRDLAAPIGIDGDVEILAIDVQRKQSAEAVKHADITNMSIDLFLKSELKHKSLFGGYLIDLKRLDEIRDNRDKLLSPKQRLDSIRYLQSPTRPSTSYNRSNGRSGPSLSIRLEAPEIGATEIKRIAGEAALIAYEPRLIRFENIGKLQNKPLKHPLLAGMNVRPKIKNGRFSKFVLELNERDEKKILYWYLVTPNGDLLKTTSSGHGGGEVSKGFRSPIPNDATLVIEMVLTKSSQTMPFEFNNIKLR